MNIAFFEALRGSRKKRIELLKLRSLWIEHHPELQQHPNRDRLLMEALRAGDEQGILRLPSPRSFERIGNPAMPMFITVIVETISVLKPDWTTVSWMPERGVWMQLTESEKVTAKVINEWLIRRKGRFMMVPLRERSLEMFGDEKYLDGRVRSNALFGGRLALSAIGARKVDLPLPYRQQPGKPGRPVLVVENHHTFFSLGEWNDTAHRYAAVVYGAGSAITSTGTALDEVIREVDGDGAEYFGDLDPEGVSIPLRYNSKHKTQLYPAIWLYRKLLTIGRHRPLPILYAGDNQAVTSWIPELAQEVHDVWKEGDCLQQEGIGLEKLLSQPYELGLNKASIDNLSAAAQS